jgi:hypothetical protein
MTKAQALRELAAIAEESCSESVFWEIHDRATELEDEENI